MIIVTCPHCNMFIEILEINCAIFRHGVFKKNNNQINPNASKEECDQYIKEDKIVGCGKPFRLVLDGETYKTVICEYI